MDIVATLCFRGCPAPACNVKVMAAVLVGVVELPSRMAGMAAVEEGVEVLEVPIKGHPVTTMEASVKWGIN